MLPITHICHNPNDNTTQHNLNTVVGLDTKIYCNQQQQAGPKQQQEQKH